MTAVIISGSLVKDTIKVFPDEFKNHIMPDNIHILNVSFTVPRKRSSWGGTGGNIAYNIKILGGNPVLVSALGVDGGAYLNHLISAGIDTRYIYQDMEIESAACDLATDKKNNQINFYYPGPTDKACDIDMTDLKDKAGLAIISPSTKDVMIKHLQDCRALRVKIIFDPGQQITSFGRDELNYAIAVSDFIFGNDYEIKLMQKHSGLTKENILDMGKTIVTTFGGRGSCIENSKIGRMDVPACRNIRVEDPTGAGDAYRAGFIIGYLRRYGLKTCLRLASVAASFAVETAGTQTHQFDKKAFIKRYRQNYGSFPRSLNLE